MVCLEGNSGTKDMKSEPKERTLLTGNNHVLGPVEGLVADTVPTQRKREYGDKERTEMKGIRYQLLRPSFVSLVSLTPVPSPREGVSDGERHGDDRE